MAVSRSSRRPAPSHRASGRRSGRTLALILVTLVSVATATVTGVVVSATDGSPPPGSDLVLAHDQSTPGSVAHSATSAPPGTGVRSGAAVPPDPTVLPGTTPQGGGPGDDEGRLPQGWTRTRFGPLSPADRDVVIRVRLAGLWEAPAGVQAQQRAGSPKVKEVGGHLAREHTTLDAAARSVAQQLGIGLPNQPTAEQRGWVAELAEQRGRQFDQTFVDRLRTAHGKIFPVVSDVRAGTRNSLIRSFTQTAVEAVMRHMTLLESTGLVKYEDLPAPPQPAANASAKPSSAGGLRALGVIWLILVGLFALGARYLFRRPPAP